MPFRHEPIDEGMERLSTTAAGLALAPLDELCDTLLDRLAISPDDDVALLAIRVRDKRCIG